MYVEIYNNGNVYFCCISYISMYKKGANHFKQFTISYLFYVIMCYTILLTWRYDMCGLTTDL